MATTAAEQEVILWDSEQVERWLGEIGFVEFSETFRENFVDGQCLLIANDEMMKELNINNEKKRFQLLQEINHLLRRSDQYQTNDWNLFFNPEQNDIKVSLENQMIQIQLLQKKVDEKDYSYSTYSRQLQEIKNEIAIVKSKIRANEEASAVSAGSSNLASALSSNAGDTVSRIPSKVRTKKSPKIPNSSGNGSGTQLFSPDSAKSISQSPQKQPTLTEKQEQILKNAMELYGRPSKHSAEPPTSGETAKKGWF